MTRLRSSAVVVPLLALAATVATPAPQALGEPAAPVSARPGTIVTAGVRCVDVAWSETTDGDDIRQWDCNDTDAQQFSIEPNPNGTMEIRTSFGKCVDVQKRSPEDGTRIQQYTCNHTPAQEFTFRPVAGQQSVQIVTFAGKCFTVAGNLASNGSPLAQEPCDEDEDLSQRFLIG
ncbi:RICIN domain-containing protein [Kitasatospora viridis]|uniref:RICIN domain-containing protein n=1 Tax=Kitasatospora viridis TaxID=281105 RepID=UPI00147853E9|nr:RICIN domain-containing protein [Kitasatospora viridis]